MQDYVGWLVFVLILAINVVWYAAKNFADANGLKVSWWYNHLLEYRNMAQLMKAGSTPSIRKRARFYLILLVALPPLPFVFLELGGG